MIPASLAFDHYGAAGLADTALDVGMQADLGFESHLAEVVRQVEWQPSSINPIAAVLFWLGCDFDGIRWPGFCGRMPFLLNCLSMLSAV